MALASKKSSPRLIPFFTFVVTVLLLLKMTNIWVGISEVSAGHFFGRQAASETSIPQVSASNTSIVAQQTLPPGGGIDTGQSSSGAEEAIDQSVIARPTPNGPDNERAAFHTTAGKPRYSRGSTNPLRQTAQGPASQRPKVHLSPPTEVAGL